MSVEVQSQTVPMLLVRMSKAKDNISSQSRRDLPNYYAISVALITSYNKFINQQPQHMTSQHCHTGFLRLTVLLSMAWFHYSPEFNKRSDSQVAYTTGATPASSS